MNKGLVITLSIIIVILLGLGIFWFVVFGCSKKYADTTTANVGDGKTLKIGVYSDSQLPGDGKDSRWTDNLKKTLETFKEQDVDVLICAGDFTDTGTVKAWKSFEEVYEKVFTDGGPEKCFIMGNHDYWLGYFIDCFDIPTVARQQNKFTKYTGELPYSHKIINGYHFINWSSSNGTYDKSYSDKEWICAQLDAAVADDPTKPIFVMTHLNPTDTIYGSDEWGNDDIYDVLKDYPQVISFSGHSHYSLLDERSIWQGEFTAVGTETIDYIELETGKYNGSVPVDAYGDNIAKYTPMGMIVTVNDSSVDIKRINTKTGEQVKDIWHIDEPLSKESITYSNEARTEKNTAPYFSNDTSVFVQKTVDNDGNMISVLTFNAALDDDFVHSYKLVFKDENGNPILFDETNYDGTIKVGKKDKEGEVEGQVKQISQLLYFSDFTKGIDNMSGTAELRLPPNIPDKVKIIEIYAVDSWKVESSPLLYSVVK